MLKDKRKEGDVISVKLVTGEEVFGRYVGEDGKSITMKKIMKLVMTAQNQPGFTSILQTSDVEEHTLAMKDIILIAPTAKQVAADYLETTSVIKAPNTKESKLII